jgi:hypothetical protein
MVKATGDLRPPAAHAVGLSRPAGAAQTKEESAMPAAQPQCGLPPKAVARAKHHEFFPPHGRASRPR